MLAISLRFPAGRYHATPWDRWRRHVNEADVEWPPSPWRLLRALIATWHRKVDASHWPEARLESLVSQLAGQPPVYALPRVVCAQTRHYMPENGRTEPVLIFDAFIHISPRAEVTTVWPDVVLSDDEHQLLQTLLGRLGYLGRAESWVEARIVEDWRGTANCWPSEVAMNRNTEEMAELVSVITPVSMGEYAERRAELLSAPAVREMRPAVRAKFEETLPERLLDALRLDNADLQAVGWSAPPAARFVTYQRPYDCFAPRPAVRTTPHRAPSRWVRFALRGKPLPGIENAVKIGELARRAAISAVERSGLGIPGVLSGHGLPVDNRHGHAFFLPEDSDSDGRIDHLLVVAELGLSAEVVDALSCISRLWEPGGGTWQVLFEDSGTEAAPHVSYLRRADTWMSVTPYLHPWHAKRGFDHIEQLKRECRERGLPELMEVETLDAVSSGGGRQLRAIHFRRFREKRGLVQPDRRGRLLRLRFARPLDGPLALGFACHFGLGLFRPAPTRG